jgi:esterase
MPERKFVEANGIRLSYIDFGGNGKPLLALHGTYGSCRTFAGLAEALGDRWRVIALDQRGHGWSDQPDDYSREAYVNDIAAFIRQAGIAPAVVLGHSLGGLNAYQLAARHPELVRAIIVEDIGADIPVFDPLRDWPLRFDNISRLFEWLEQQGYSHDQYFLESLIEYPDGWGFRFDHAKMGVSLRMLAGDWWQDWLASRCPALLLHGHRSWVLETSHARDMAARRQNTRLIEFPECGHTIHNEKPGEFNHAVEQFLLSIE